MRSLLLVILFSCVLGSAHGMELKIERPDYVKIKQLTHDTSSVYYYPALLKRYNENDTSLKQEDYTMLYFGYFFQTGYKPNSRSSVYNDSLRELLNKDHLTKGEWKKVISYIHKYFDIYPFSLEKLNILFIAYHNINDEYYSIKYRNKLEMLIKTILSTGDGKTSKTGYHVLLHEDEFAFLSVMGYEYGGKQSHTDDHCDYVQLSRNPDGLDGLYFDVRQIIYSNK